MKLQHHHERFQATRPVYREAVAAGLIKGQIPPHLGGTGGSLLEAAIMVEEMYAVEPSAALTIFGTGLGLTPINLTGKPEHERYLAPFLSGEGEPLASLVFSEPGGVANWLEKGAPGLATTAELQGDKWVLNGDKVRPVSCNLQCSTCPSSSPRFGAHPRIDHAQCRSGLLIAPVGTSKVPTSNASSVAVSTLPLPRPTIPPPQS